MILPSGKANIAAGCYPLRMPQLQPWEREYKNPRLVTLGDEPQKDLMKCLKFLRKERGVALSGLRVLDVGAGVGKNSIHLAELGNDCVGIEISPTAVAEARRRATETGVTVDFRTGDIGQPYPFPDASFDLVLDIMSSNSLNDAERETYARETRRVLKPGGHMIVRGLCKDGDKNANALLKSNPGPEKDTYVMPGMDLVERVFTREDFLATYSPRFEVLELDKKTNYARVGDRQFKRNYWLAVLAARP